MKIYEKQVCKVNLNAMVFARRFKISYQDVCIIIVYGWYVMKYLDSRGVHYYTLSHFREIETANITFI